MINDRDVVPFNLNGGLATNSKRPRFQLSKRTEPRTENEIVLRQSGLTLAKAHSPEKRKKARKCNLPSGDAALAAAAVGYQGESTTIAKKIAELSSS